MIPVMIFLMLVYYGTEGCPSPPSLTQIILTPKNSTSLFCALCLGQGFQPPRNVTFLWYHKGRLLPKSQKGQVSIYALSSREQKGSGMWRCQVKEYPNISAEYYLGAERNLDKDVNISSIPFTFFIVLVVVTFLTFAGMILIVTMCHFLEKRSMAVTQHQEKGARGPGHHSVPKDLEPGSCDRDNESGEDVCYAELQLPEKPGGRSVTSHSTVYASIM